MKIPLYLAITAAEIKAGASFPSKPAWMACHFDTGGRGLSNIPQDMPKGSLLLLDDSVLPTAQEPAYIASQVSDILSHGYAGLLLDFMHPGNEKLAETAKVLTGLPYPVIVAESYAKDLSCPVFLPPVPPNQTVDNYLKPYSGREIWLEAACDGMKITVSRSGAHFQWLPGSDGPLSHYDSNLYCHYRSEVKDNKIIFTLQRAREDLKDLLSKAEKLGIKACVGLYQELR